MSRTIYMVQGCKGGTGKSTFTLALIDYLDNIGKKIFVIDADTSNPDVGIIIESSGGKVEYRDLDLDTGWIKLLNDCEEHRNCDVVINSAARSEHAMNRFIHSLTSALPDLKRTLVIYWVLNHQRYSVELLENFMEIIGTSKTPCVVHAVKNEYFGRAENFGYFDSSDIKSQITEGGGSIITLPRLDDINISEIMNNQMSIAKAMKKLPFGNRHFLDSWRSRVAKQIEFTMGVL